MFGSVISAIFSGIISPIVTAWSDVRLQSLKSEVDGFTAAIGGDAAIGKAFLEAQTQNAQIKAASNTWIGARLIIVAAGLPAAIHFGAVMLDSTFQFGWEIPKCPSPYDSYEWSIIQSFFFVAPAMPIMSAAAAWLSRRR